jgi:hypothetical protein
MAENSAGTAKRGPGRPFAAGVSGNPAGRPRTLAALEAEIRDLHGPHVLEVLDKLRTRAMGGDVRAARLFLDRVLGPARVPANPLPLAPAATAAPITLLDSVDAAAFDVTARALRLVTAQVEALETKARDEGLTTEESASLADCVRAASGVGKWHWEMEKTIKEKLDSLPAGERRELAERAMCEALGITVEQLATARAGCKRSSAEP